jgi:hypothetical protein
MLTLSLFVRARPFAADELAEQGRYTNAAKSLLGSLQLAQRGVDADGAMIHYLIAGSARTLVHGEITRFAVALGSAAGFAGATTLGVARAGRRNQQVRQDVAS